MWRGPQYLVWSIIPVVLCVAGCAGPAPTAAPNDTTRREFETRFVRFCELATAELNEELTPFLNRTNADPATHHMPQKNVDMAGLPYLMYSFARQIPELRGITATADGELKYIGDILLAGGDPNVSRLMTWEVMTWGMLSYAERLQPGGLERGARSNGWPTRPHLRAGPAGLKFEDSHQGLSRSEDTNWLSRGT